mgnify:CR=1 FL=1|jgi:hypothetical protein|tara:strand:- start:23651 stop:23932 length:282 start_codon:yes stop_codon:yes gene_type:complete
MEHIQIDIFNKYLTIKKDIIANIVDVYNRQHYYTHKYRGNVLLDVHVGVGLAEDSSKKEVQIFVRFKGYYIKDNIIYDNKKFFSSTIKTNLNE